MITVVGSGDITLPVGTQIIELSGIENSIIIDIKLEGAYYGDTLKKRADDRRIPCIGLREYRDQLDGKCELSKRDTEVDIIIKS